MGSFGGQRPRGESGRNGSIPSILVGQFCVFLFNTSTSFSNITSDSSINFVTNPLFALRFARYRGRASKSVILKWLRFTAPRWAPSYKLVNYSRKLLNLFIYLSKK